MATVAQQLTEARAARHKLVTGQMARVFMDQNGERIEYVSTNIAQLDAYIRSLEAQVSPSLAGIRANRPIGFTF